VRRVWAVIPLVLLVLLFSTDSVFAQSSTVVTTDKASYSEGETILVTGEVVQLLGGYKLSFTVMAPNGNIVSIEQLIVGADKKFSTSIPAGGALMKTEGTYTITVQYGDNKNNEARTTFEFGGSTTTPPSEVESNLKVEGSKESIKIGGLESIVKNMQVDKEALSIIFSMNVKKSGSFTIDIPRGILDATLNGRDVGFFVLVDGIDVKYVETKSTTHRNLTIPYTSGAQEIEIIGTFVVGGANLYQTPNSKCGAGTIFNPITNSCVLLEEQEPLPYSGSGCGSGTILDRNTNRCVLDSVPTPEPEELEIPAPFVDQTKDSQFYVDRYNNESEYKEWFDYNFPEYSSIYQAVGLSEPIPEWVKGVFTFWTNGNISDDELKNAIKFLVESGIIEIDD